LVHARLSTHKVVAEPVYTRTGPTVVMVPVAMIGVSSRVTFSRSTFSAAILQDT
jgi:hypothetical protein